MENNEFYNMEANNQNKPKKKNKKESIITALSTILFFAMIITLFVFSFLEKPIYYSLYTILAFFAYAALLFFIKFLKTNKQMSLLKKHIYDLQRIQGTICDVKCIKRVSVGANESETFEFNLEYNNKVYTTQLTYFYGYNNNPKMYKVGEEIVAYIYPAQNSEWFLTEEEYDNILKRK